MPHPTKVQALAHIVAIYQLLRIATIEAYGAELVPLDPDEPAVDRRLRSGLEDCLAHQRLFSSGNADEAKLLDRCIDEMKKQTFPSHESASEVFAAGKEGVGSEGVEDLGKARERSKIEAIAHMVAAYRILRTALLEARDTEESTLPPDEDGRPYSSRARIRNLQRLRVAESMVQRTLDECLRSHGAEESGDRDALAKCVDEMGKEDDGEYGGALELLAMGNGSILAELGRIAMVKLRMESERIIQEGDAEEDAQEGRPTTS